MSVAKTRVTPTAAVMCKSCPQACITAVSPPRPSCVLRVLANASPVSSFTGNPSRSQRSNTVGPAPFLKTATTPFVPTPNVTSAPAARSSEASRLDVSTSCHESSGAA